jgi:glutaredoxin
MQKFGSSSRKYQSPPISRSNKSPACNSSRVSSKSGNELWMWVGFVVVIILIISLSLWYSNCSGDTFSEKFSNTFKKGGNAELRDMDVLFFMSPACGWCQKMKAMMEREKSIRDVKLVDVTKPEGLELAKQYGSVDKGVPSFVSKKLKTGTVGFKETTAELINSLKKAKDSPEVPQMNPEEAVNRMADLQVMLFTSPTCGWCNKAKEALKEAGVSDYVEIIDISTPEGKALVQQQIPEFRGVPVAKSKATGKIATGYKAVPQLVAELSA